VTAAVVDASLIVRLLTSQSRAIADVVAGYDSHHAPSHLDVESVNALRGMLLGRQLGMSKFEMFVGRMPMVPVTRHEIGPLIPRIVSLANNATAYDAAYLALAEVLDADVLAGDAALARVPGITCRVRVL
jgi:predicted nucleic acid-binding protein